MQDLSSELEHKNKRKKVKYKMCTSNAAQSGITVAHIANAY